MGLTKYLQESFRLLKLVHSSDKTKIFLVEEIATCQKFLLKVINRTGLLYSQIAKIKNVTLPKIYHVEESDSATYVVEEYLQGMDLQEYLDLRGKLNEQITCRLAIEVCDCLQELHKWHIIHRDIKPSNLFLTNAGKVKLIDFDAARLEKPGRFADTHFIGTPGFAAPEQYGFHQTDERTDIYALGLTLKLLLGYENYHGFLSPVLAKCTEFDPNKRFDSARSLKRAIIWRRQFHEWKNFFACICLGVIGLSSYFLSPSVVQKVSSPDFIGVPAVQEKVLPAELKPQSEPTLPEKTSAEPSTKSLETFVAEELIVPIIANELTYYETPVSQELPTKSVPKPAREIDYSMADSSDFQERGIPRKVLEHNMSDLPVEERDKKIDEYHKRMELNSRQKNFAASLPNNMSQEEKNVAIMEFRRRTKESLNLK